MFFLIKAQLYSLYWLFYSLYFDPKKQAEEWSMSKLRKLALEKKQLREGKNGVTSKKINNGDANVPLKIA